MALEDALVSTTLNPVPSLSNSSVQCFNVQGNVNKTFLVYDKYNGIPDTLIINVIAYVVSC